MTIQYINNCNILNMQMRIKNKLIINTKPIYTNLNPQPHIYKSIFTK